MIAFASQLITLHLRRWNFNGNCSSLPWCPATTISSSPALTQPHVRKPRPHPQTSQSSNAPRVRHEALLPGLGPARTDPDPPPREGPAPGPVRERNVRERRSTAASGWNRAALSTCTVRAGEGGPEPGFRLRGRRGGLGRRGCACTGAVESVGCGMGVGGGREHGGQGLRDFFRFFSYKSYRRYIRYITLCMPVGKPSRRAPAPLSASHAKDFFTLFVLQSF